MNIQLDNPTVFGEFQFNPSNFDIFLSTCFSDDVDCTFSRNVSNFSWPNTSIKINGEIIGLGEDPRAFDMMGSPACFSIRFNEIERFVPQLYIKGDDGWDSIKIQMEDDLPVGKNWNPFVYNEEIYFVHEISPFRVLKLEGDTVKTVFSIDIDSDIMPIDKYSVLRGGCNGLQISETTVMGFGHSNHASDVSDINSIIHRPFVWSVNMQTQKVDIINLDFPWDSKYNIIDPTALITINDEIVLQTCETELVWNNNNQSGRHCLYKVTGIE
jgi:hypothetical protein